MSMSPSLPPNIGTTSLWDFAVATYRCDGVAPACLDLQDICGVDVPLFLCAGFAVVQGKRFDKVALNELQQIAEPWQRDIVAALRAIRRQLKSGPHPAPNASSDSLRASVKAAELAAEKIQLDAMQSAATGLPKSNGSVTLDNVISALTLVVATSAGGEVPVPQTAQIAMIARSMLDQLA
jgi:uncharacterized protein (TIGR02444 family)